MHANTLQVLLGDHACPEKVTSQYAKIQAEMISLAKKMERLRKKSDVIVARMDMLQQVSEIYQGIPLSVETTQSANYGLNVSVSLPQSHPVFEPLCDRVATISEHRSTYELTLSWEDNEAVISHLDYENAMFAAKQWVAAAMWPLLKDRLSKSAPSCAKASYFLDKSHVNDPQLLDTEHVASLG